MMLHGLETKLPLVSQLSQMSPDNHCAMIWQPFAEVSKAKELEKTWQTTSDSIALWLAAKLQAKQLVLVKSAQVEGLSITEILNAKAVDENFSSLMDDYKGKITCMHASNAHALIHTLEE